MAFTPNLSYLRDRLLLCRELLADTGAIFMQINDENLSLVHLVMSEVFGADNFVVHISFNKKGNQKGGLLDPVNDFLIWFANNKSRVRQAYNQLFEPMPLDSDLVKTFRYVELPDGDDTTLAKLEKTENRPDRYFRDQPDRVLSEHPGARIFTSGDLTAGGFRNNQSIPFRHEGETFDPGVSKGNLKGELLEAHRSHTGGFTVWNGSACGRKPPLRRSRPTPLQAIS